MHKPQESTCGCVGALYKHLCVHVSVSAYMSTAEHVRLCVRVKEPRRMGRDDIFAIEGEFPSCCSKSPH